METESTPAESYDDAFFPYTFYFNGRALPRWAANWSLGGIQDHLTLKDKLDQEVNHTEIFIVSCRIDHVGTVESEDPDVFLYSIQEVLLILLRERDAVQDHLRESLDDADPAIYDGLLEGAFLMRELVLKERRAFWTSGYEEDRLRLLATMDACAPARPVTQAQLPPHLKRRKRHLESLTSGQLSEFRKLSYDKTLAPKLRTRLQSFRK